MRKAAARHDPEEKARRVADAVYGTILVIAVVAALSKDDAATPQAILGGALATSLVFWVVHVYAEMLSRRTAGDRRPTWPVLREAAEQEWPLVSAAIAPMVPLLLGWIGVVDRSTSITLSILVGLGGLAGWGYAAGRQMGQSPIKSLVTAAGAVALGAVMVLLKNLVH